jgi:hypothetical protein
MRVAFLPWLAGTLRGEHFADPNGFTTGTVQRLEEGTATIESRHTMGGVTAFGRVEYRRDRSDARTLVTASGTALTHQDTVTFAVLAAF